MTPELKILGLIVIFIMGGIATHFFHTWNRTRLGQLNQASRERSGLMTAAVAAVGGGSEQLSR